MTDELEVHGGATIAVDTAAMHGLVDQFGATAELLLQVARDVGWAFLRAHVELLVTTVVSPRTAALAGEALREGALDTMGLISDVKCVGDRVRGAAQAYRATEDRNAALMATAGSYAALLAPRTPVIGPVQELPDRPAPTDLADLVSWFDAPPGSPPGSAGQIEVYEHVSRDQHGRRETAYAVLIPGTSSLLPPGVDRLDDDIRNNTANLQLMAGQDTPELQVLPEVLTRAGVPAGAALTLIGHSQGGMTAMRAASDPRVKARYRVPHVITLGSPIGNMARAPGTSVLSLENRADLVPTMDGRTNRADSRRVTVRFGRQTPDLAFNEHRTSRYVHGAAQVDTSAHPGLVRFEKELRDSGVLARPGGSAPPTGTPGGRVRVRRIVLSLADAR